MNAQANLSSLTPTVQPYTCSIWSRTTSGVGKNSPFELDLPNQAHGPGGAHMIVRYLWLTPTGTNLQSAECSIPRTLAALDRLSERLGVPEALRRPSGRTPGGEEMTTQSCVDDGVCALDPVVVVAPPADDGGEDSGDDDTCTLEGCMGGGDGDGTGGGDGGGDGGDSGYDDSGSSRSAQDWDGVGDLLQCPTDPPEFDPVGCDKIDAALDWLQKHENATCRQFGFNAGSRHARGDYRIMYYSGKYGGYFNGIVGLTELAFTPGELANTIAHEEAHALGSPDKYIDGALQEPGPDGRYAGDWGRTCASGSV